MIQRQIKLVPPWMSTLVRCSFIKFTMYAARIFQQSWFHSWTCSFSRAHAVHGHEKGFIHKVWNFSYYDYIHFFHICTVDFERCIACIYYLLVFLISFYSYLILTVVSERKRLQRVLKPKWWFIQCIHILAAYQLLLWRGRRPSRRCVGPVRNYLETLPWCRFSRFFVEPLFLPDCVDRELLAVDSGVYFAIFWLMHSI